MDPVSLRPDGELVLPLERPHDQERAVLVATQDDRLKTYPVVVKYIHSPRLGSDVSPEILWSNVEILKSRIRAARLNDLDHDRVLPCYGFELRETPFYYVVERPRSEWKTLQSIVDATTPIPAEKLRLLYSAAGAVAHLHSRNPPVVHGNIEPSQFAISPRADRAILLDFGLTHALRYLRNDSNGLGKSPPLNPGFASPRLTTAFNETKELTVELDPSDDVFAFASTILTVMSGTAPLVGGDPSEQQRHPELPSNDPLWKLLGRMWGPENLQPTMSEVVRSLEAEYIERRDLTVQTIPRSPTSIIFDDMGSLRLSHDETIRHEPLEELADNALFFPSNPTSFPGPFTTTNKGWLLLSGLTMQVAVKSLNLPSPDNDVRKLEMLRRRAKREFLFLLTLRSPYLLKLEGYQLRPVPAVVYAWCSNGNILEYIEGGPGLTAYQVLRLMLQVTRGILFLHTRKPVPVVHGDIKPQNVVIGEQGQALVCDYGLNKLFQTMWTTYNPVDLASGSPSSVRYLAPEGILGTYAQPADIWGLAGLILACLSRKEPFAELSTAEILRRLSGSITPKPEEHPNLSAEDPLWLLMEKCWRFKPGDRPDIYEVEAEVREERDIRGGKPRTRNNRTVEVTWDDDVVIRQLASVAMNSASRAFPEALEPASDMES